MSIKLTINPTLSLNLRILHEHVYVHISISPQTLSLAIAPYLTVEKVEKFKHLSCDDKARKLFHSFQLILIIVIIFRARQTTFPQGKLSFLSHSHEIMNQTHSKKKNKEHPRPILLFLFEFSHQKIIMKMSHEYINWIFSSRT